MAMPMTIYVVSGEGEQGKRVEYTGALTVRALKSRLTRERCGGDRWARVEIGLDAAAAEETTPEEAIAAVERELGDLVHEYNGRWLVASWSTRNQQYTSGDRDRVPQSERNSYCYTYARTLEGLVSEGIRTYKTRAKALARAAGHQ